HRRRRRVCWRGSGTRSDAACARSRTRRPAASTGAVGLLAATTARWAAPAPAPVAERKPSRKDLENLQSRRSPGRATGWGTPFTQRMLPLLRPILAPSGCGMTTLRVVPLLLLH
ncbi:unnamed protein product, partial [Ectocarpus sp. 4 AP-2014]